MENNNKKIDITNIIQIISAILLIMSAFMPYISVSFLGTNISKSLIDGGDGYLFIIVSIIIIILNLSKSSKKNTAVIILSIIAILLAFIELMYTSSKLSEYSQYINKGWGFYLTILCPIVILIISIYERKTKK